MIHIMVSDDQKLESAADWCVENEVGYDIINAWPNRYKIFSLNTKDQVTITSFMLKFYNTDGTSSISWNV
jgi:hypothetical protein